MHQIDEINQIALFDEEDVEKTIDRCTTILELFAEPQIDPENPPVTREADEAADKKSGIGEEKLVSSNDKYRRTMIPHENTYERATLYHLRGESHFKVKKDQLALFDVEMALALYEPDLPSHLTVHSHILRGKILVRMEKVLDAIEELETVVRHESDAEVLRLSHFHLGKLYANVPLFSTAAIHFSHVAQVSSYAHKLTLLYREASHVCQLDELHKLIHSLPDTSDPFVLEFAQNLTIFFVLRKSIERLSRESTQNIQEFLKVFTKEIRKTADEVLKAISSGKLDHAEINEETLVYVHKEPRAKLSLFYLGDLVSSIDSSMIIEFCTRKMLFLRESANFFKDVDHAIRPHHEISIKPMTDFVTSLNELSKLTEPDDLSLSNFSTKPYRFRNVPQLVESCLTPPEWGLLHASLENRSQHRPWHLLFSSKTHGASFMTFRHRLANRGPTLFIIHTVSGEKIGAFIESPVKVSPTVHFGNSSSFIFSTNRETFRPGYNTLQVYRPSGQNPYYCLFTHEYFTLGGGDHVAIRIDQNLDTVHSHPCATFDSPALLPVESCEIVNLEAWCL